MRNNNRTYNSYNINLIINIAMKKLILSCAAAFAIFAMVSCSGKAGKLADIYKDATEQIKAANGDVSKQMEIQKETAEKVTEITKDMNASDLLKLADNEEYKAAYLEYTKAVGGGIMEAGAAAVGGGSSMGSSSSSSYGDYEKAARDYERRVNKAKRDMGF